MFSTYYWLLLYILFCVLVFVLCPIARVIKLWILNSTGHSFICDTPNSSFSSIALILRRLQIIAFGL